jgi:hypothetical protein
MLAKSIGTLTDLHPDQDLGATLQQAVQAAKQLFDADAAGVMLVDIDGSLRWASASDQRAQILEDNQEVFAAGPCWRRSPLVGRRSCTTPPWSAAGGRSPWSLSRSGSVGVECPGGPGWWPDWYLDVYAVDPRGWDQSELSALRAYAGVVANLLGVEAKAQLRGALAEQPQVALDSRGLIERAKGALMERERLDDQEAFTHLRRAARSSGRKLTELAREVAAGQPLPRIRTRPSRTRPEQADGEADTP